MSNISIVTNDEHLQTVGQSLPQNIKAMVTPLGDGLNAEQLVNQLVELRSSVAVFGSDSPESLIVETAAMLRKSHPEISCVAFRRHDPQFFAFAIRNGLRDVLDPETDGLDGLRGALVSLSNETELLKSHLLASEASKVQDGTITILGPKGGVGKTTVAINLAYGLAVANPNQVVLVDLDLVAGEVSDLLQLEPTRTIASLATAGAYLDSTTLKLSLSNHASGLLVLPAPATLVEAEAVDPESVVKILDLLATLFRFVVVDTGPGSTDMVVSAIRAAREILVVTAPEISGLRTLDMHLSALRQANLSSAPQHIVLNRADEKSGVSAATVQEALGAEVRHEIPFDRKMTLAANQGVPYLESNTKGPTTLGLSGLIAAMSGELEEPALAKKRFW